MEIIDKIYCKNCKYYMESFCEHPVCFEIKYCPINGPYKNRKFNYDSLNENFDCKYFIQNPIVVKKKWWQIF